MRYRSEAGKEERKKTWNLEGGNIRRIQSTKEKSRMETTKCSLVSQGDGDAWYGILIV